MRPLPELFDLGVKARSLAYLFVAGALLGLLTLLLPHDEAVQDLQLYVLAAIAIAVAALIYVQAERVSEWQLHLVLAAGTTILSFANYYAGTSTLYPLLYTWTALYAFYFFGLRAGARPRGLHRRRLRRRAGDPGPEQPGDPLAAGGRPRR